MVYLKSGMHLFLKKIKRNSPQHKSPATEAFIQRMVDELDSDDPEDVKRRIVENELLYDETDLLSDDNYIDIYDDIDMEVCYNFDQEKGSIPIGDLPIGARVIDPTWKWEYRTDDGYSGVGQFKPVTWIVVAKNHYEGLNHHVTLLTEELIGLFPFDNSTNRNPGSSEEGCNHWGESGSPNATRGLCPWLNSTGIHSHEGFYQAFSMSFKKIVMETTLPNKEWINGATYSTKDFVFIPSTTELDDSDHEDTYQIGSVYPYFSTSERVERLAGLGGKMLWYQTRSPDSRFCGYVRSVDSACDFHYDDVSNEHNGVRPALNVKADTLVSESRD